MEDLTVCSRKRLFVTGQHDWRVTFLAGQVTILARDCPLTGRYFEPQKVFLFSVKDVLPAPNPAARLDLSQPHPRGSFLPVSESDRKKRDLGVWERGLSQAKLHNSVILRIVSEASTHRLYKPYPQFPLLSQVGAWFHFRKSSW